MTVIAEITPWKPVIGHELEELRDTEVGRRFGIVRAGERTRVRVDGRKVIILAVELGRSQ